MQCTASLRDVSLRLTCPVCRWEECNLNGFVCCVWYACEDNRARGDNEGLHPQWMQVLAQSPLADASKNTHL